MNCKDSVTLNKYTDTTHAMTMAADVANPFRMLSAYFMTTATRIPPNDWSVIIKSTTESYPWKNPFSLIYRQNMYYCQMMTDISHHKCLNAMQNISRS